MNEEEIKTKILKMAADRGVDKTICPSEVARNLFPENWRNQMQQVREAAFKLRAEDQVQILQKGNLVDPETVKGPIRIRITIGKNPP